MIRGSHVLQATIVVNMPLLHASHTFFKHVRIINKVQMNSLRSIEVDGWPLKFCQYLREDRTRSFRSWIAYRRCLETIGWPGIANEKQKIVIGNTWQSVRNFFEAPISIQMDGRNVSDGNHNKEKDQKFEQPTTAKLYQDTDYHIFIGFEPPVILK